MHEFGYGAKPTCLRLLAHFHFEGVKRTRFAGYEPFSF
jgi:hypothetical protein